MPKLLLIEDNSQIQRIYSEKFRREGFDVTTAEDGEQGLAAAQTSHPDAVLLDIMLPKLNGFEVLKKLQEDTALNKVPVFMLSNRAWPTDVQQAMALGARQFYSKGTASLQDIVTQIRTACGFKKVTIISGNVISAQALTRAAAHPQILCSVQTVAVEACTASERGAPDLIVLDGRAATAPAILQQLKCSPALKSVSAIVITDQPAAFPQAEECVPVSSIATDLQNRILSRLALSAEVTPAHAQN